MILEITSSSKELATNGALCATFRDLKIPAAYKNRIDWIRENIISPRAKDVLPTAKA